MSVKSKLKHILGSSGADKAIRAKKSSEYLRCKMTHQVGKIEIADSRSFEVYRLPGQNVFFGYYDLKQYDPSGSRLLAHIVRSGADPLRDEAGLVWFERGGSEPHEIARTRAWCWQQGARLRWHPARKDHVLYNDLEDGRYVTRDADLAAGSATTVCRALYDVDPAFRFGLTLNFSRLQALRPGYGYARLPDPDASDRAPADDGLFRVDLTDGSERLLFRLSDLADGIGGSGKHYLNHISVSPSGARFIFFHLWTAGAGSPWSMRLMCAESDGTGLRCLLDDMTVSHYCWFGDTELLVTNSKGQYLFVDALTGARRVVAGEHLDRDGHPSPLAGGFLSDTYPQEDHTQNVFLCRRDGSGYKRLLRVFSDPRRYGEQRCDLHPRVHADGSVTVDTTAFGEVRGMLAFSLNEQEMKSR